MANVFSGFSDMIPISTNQTAEAAIRADIPGIQDGEVSAYLTSIVGLYENGSGNSIPMRFSNTPLGKTRAVVDDGVTVTGPVRFYGGSAAAFLLIRA